MTYDKWFNTIKIFFEKRRKKMKKRDVVFWFLLGFVLVYLIGFFVVKEKMLSGYITIGSTVFMPILGILSAGMSFNIHKDKELGK